MRLLRTFTKTDAVEGAVEVRLELADTLLDYRPRVRLLLLGLLLGVGLAVVSAFWQAGAFLNYLGDLLADEIDFDLPAVALGTVLMMLSLLVLALGAADLLFAYQMRRFFAVLRARYGTLGGGTTGGVMHEARERGGDDDVEEDEERVRDPASTLLGLAREAEGEIPQVDTLLKYCTAFTFLLAVFMIGTVATTALGGTLVADDRVPVVTGLHLGAFVFLTLSVLLLMEVQGFVNYFSFRVTALETFEGLGPVPVPPGETHLDRLEYCLVSTGLSKDSEMRPGSLRGSSGREHHFDLVIGDGTERALVRVYGGVPGIEELRDLRKAAEDVARTGGGLPARVVALVGAEVDDLDVDDVVFDFIMEHPILDAKGERARSLQIVAEVEGRYSVLPFTVP